MFLWDWISQVQDTHGAPDRRNFRNWIRDVEGCAVFGNIPCPIDSAELKGGRVCLDNGLRLTCSQPANSSLIIDLLSLSRASISVNVNPVS